MEKMTSAHPETKTDSSENEPRRGVKNLVCRDSPYRSRLKPRRMTASLKNDKISSPGEISLYD